MVARLLALACVAAALVPARAHAQASPFDPALRRALDGTAADASPLRRTAADPLLGVVVSTRDVGALRRAGVSVEAVFDGFATARVRASDLGRVARLPGVTRVTMGDDERLHNDVAGALVGARALHDGLLGGSSYRGAGAIVCVFDSGIDFRHLDFRSTSDTTQSRLLRLYDMTLTATGAETPPQGLASTYTTGVEYTRAHLNDELDGTPAGFVRSQDTNGHGTHVAATAAGNGGAMTPRQHIGMAPDADIVFVKGGNGSFSTANILNGLTYCGEVAAKEGKPVVVNFSLGSDSGPHDGQDTKSAAIDQFVQTPGRVVVQSAGNSGNSFIHRTGTLAPGDSVVLQFNVGALGTAGDPAFGVDLWSNGRSLRATVVTPDGTRLTRNAGSDTTFTSNAQGAVYLFNYLVTGTAARDGDLDREIYLYSHNSTGTNRTAAGLWQLIVKNVDTTSDTWHAWLFDATSGGSAVGFVGADALSTIANAALGGISVGSYEHRFYWSGFNGSGYSTYSYTDGNRQDLRSSFSSQGPSRDGRTLPDISAPGQAILSARSRHATYTNSDLLASGKHVKNQGTSMSAPVVSGSVALLLGASPALTATQVRTLLTGNAIVDASVGTAPNNQFGAGKLNVYQAMARLVDPSSSSTLQTVQYDAPGTATSGLTLALGSNLLLRFTAPLAGRLRGVLLHNSATAPSGGYTVRLWTNSGGVPGTQIGASVSYPAASVLLGTWNYIETSALTDALTSGTDYFVTVTPVGSAGSYRHDGATTTSRTSTATTSGSAFATPTTQAYDALVRPIVTSGAGALPVELVAFEGVAAGRRVALSWITASETDNAGWSVETLGRDGQTWRTLRFVAGAGTSSEAHRYAVETADLAPGVHRFRLRQTDLDGTATLSPEISVEVGVTRDLTLALAGPNPARGATSLVYTVPTDGRVTAEVVDLLGRRVALLFEGEAAAGQAHRLDVETGALGAGVYVVRLAHGDRTVQQRLVVAR